MNRAIVLLSGGIDSSTALYLTRKETNEIYTINIQYAQASIREVSASKNLAAAAGVKEHIGVSLPFYKDIQARYHPPSSASVSSAYVPARNLVFYGIATAFAETLGVDRIVFGSNAADAEELPDASPKFIQLMNESLRIGTRMGLEGNGSEIVNPLINYDKAQVVKLALSLNVPLELTWSCYEDVEMPCGKCCGCSTRLHAFQQLGVSDPLRYATN